MAPLPLSQHLTNVSTIAYGCMGLGGGWNRDPVTAEHVRQANEVLDTALEVGINFFDHADIYTLGKAEQVFGEVLKTRPGLREQLYLQSKCAIRFGDETVPGRYDFSATWINASVDNILSRLQTDYLDVLMLHRPDPLMDLDETATVLNALSRSGKVRHIAVSNMHHHQMRFLQSALEKPLVANQIEISLKQLEWLEEGVYAGNPDGNQVNFTAGTLEYCRQHNVQLQSWSPLCQGLYTGKDTRDAPQAVQATAALVSELAEAHQVSGEAVVIAFLLRHPANIQPVIGTTQPSRIKGCAEATRITLSREDWYRLYVTSRGKALP